MLVDMGLATTIDEKNNLLPRCGSPGYIGPEIIRREDYDTSADVFSVGITFFFMLTGRNPFPVHDKKLVLEDNLRCDINFDMATHGAYVTAECSPICNLRC